MALKDEKGICESPPENVIPQHPDCDPEFAECEHDNKISIDLVPGECATRGTDAHFKKGYELYHLGRLDEAIDELKASLAARPTAEARLILGDIYERRLMYDKAIDEYTEALRLDPGDKQTRFKLETALGQKKRL